MALLMPADSRGFDAGNGPGLNSGAELERMVGEALASRPGISDTKLCHCGSGEAFRKCCAANITMAQVALMCSGPISWLHLLPYAVIVRTPTQSGLGTANAPSDQHGRTIVTSTLEVSKTFSGALRIWQAPNHPGY